MNKQQGRAIARPLRYAITYRGASGSGVWGFHDHLEGCDFETDLAGSAEAIWTLDPGATIRVLVVATGRYVAEAVPVAGGGVSLALMVAAS